MGNLIITAIIQLIVSWILIGIVWYTQIIHYPLYRKIKEGFVEYERSHIRRSAFMIGPLMLIEAITATMLVGLSEGLLAKFALINFIFVALIWLSTFLFQVTQHQKLSVRFSRRILNNLIASNWIRTMIWTGKGIIMAAYMYYYLSHAYKLHLEHIF